GCLPGTGLASAPSVSPGRHAPACVPGTKPVRPGMPGCSAFCDKPARYRHPALLEHLDGAVVDSLEAAGAPCARPSVQSLGERSAACHYRLHDWRGLWLHSVSSASTGKGTGQRLTLVAPS